MAARRVAGPDGLILRDTVVLRRSQGGGAGESAPLFAAARRTIRRGSSGRDVSEAQFKLNRVHASGHLIDRCPLAVDGVFGPDTSAAAVSFQRFAFPGQPNEWDSVIGPRTWSMLDAYARDEASAVPPYVPPLIGGDPPGIVPVVFSDGFNWTSDPRFAKKVAELKPFAASSSTLDTPGPATDALEFPEFKARNKGRRHADTSAAAVSFQRFAFPGQPKEWD
eukprot:gene55870-76589_t